MILRFYKIFLFLLVLEIVVGFITFITISQLSHWSDFFQGIQEYSLTQLKSHPGLWSGFFVVLLFFGGGIIVMAIRSRDHLPLSVYKEMKVNSDLGTLNNTQQIISLIQRRLDKEFCHPEPMMDQIIDTLLGIPVDFPLQSLLFEPDDMLVTINMELNERLIPVTTLSKLLYKRIIDELRLLIGVDEIGENFVTLTAYQGHGIQRLRVVLEDGQHGVIAKIQIFHGEGASFTSLLPIPRNRPNSVVFRIRDPSMLDQDSQGINSSGLYYLDEYDRVDSDRELSSIREPSVPYNTNEISLFHPSNLSQLGYLEQLSRFVFVIIFSLGVCGFFWPSYKLFWKYNRSGYVETPWRAVAIEVVSQPIKGKVMISGKSYGKTPISLFQSCQGETIEILVEALGYSTWQWSGLCPKEGAIRLRANLKPLDSSIQKK